MREREGGLKTDVWLELKVRTHFCLWMHLILLFKTSLLQQLSSVCKLRDILYRLYCNYYHCWWLMRQFWHSNNILCPIEIQSNFIRFIFIPRMSCNMTTHSHEMFLGLWQSVASLCPRLLLSRWCFDDFLRSAESWIKVYHKVDLSTTSSSQCSEQSPSVISYFKYNLMWQFEGGVVSYYNLFVKQCTCKQW